MIMSSRLVWATQQDPVSKNKQNEKTKQQFIKNKKYSNWAWHVGAYL
jgi:hypothetical protein